MYKLLTPGPLTTTDTVKREMLVDHCTWDDDYKSITQNIRKELLELVHVTEDEYTVVLMQGSGTFGVESVVTRSASIFVPSASSFPPSSLVPNVWNTYCPLYPLLSRAFFIATTASSSAFE